MNKYNIITMFVICFLSIFFYNCSAPYSSMRLHDGTFLSQIGISEENAESIPILNVNSAEIFFKNGTLHKSLGLGISRYGIEGFINSINNKDTLETCRLYNDSRYLTLPGKYRIGIKLSAWNPMYDMNGKIFFSCIVDSRNGITHDAFYKKKYYFNVNIENAKAYGIGITDLDFYDNSDSILYVHKAIPVFCEGICNLWNGFKPNKVIKNIDIFETNNFELSQVDKHENTINLFLGKWFNNKDSISTIKIEGEGLRLLNMVGKNSRGYKINFENRYIDTLEGFVKNYNNINLLSGDYIIELDYYDGSTISAYTLKYRLVIKPMHSYVIELIEKGGWLQEIFSNTRKYINIYDKTDNVYLEPTKYK